jgi:hypothetical protein
MIFFLSVCYLKLMDKNMRNNVICYFVPNKIIHLSLKVVAMRGCISWDYFSTLKMEATSTRTRRRYIAVVWSVTSCSLVGGYRRFGRKFCHHIQVESVSAYSNTQRHNQKNLLHEKIKIFTIFMFLADAKDGEPGTYNSLILLQCNYHWFISDSLKQYT